MESDAQGSPKKVIANKQEKKSIKEINEKTYTNNNIFTQPNQPKQQRKGKLGNKFDLLMI